MIARDDLPDRERSLAMLAIILGIFTAVMDTVVVTVVLPVLAEAFRNDASAIVWVVLLHQFVTTISLFPLGALGDRIGYRVVFCGGAALLTVASLAAGSSGSLPTLLVARVFQALGSSAMMSSYLALVRFSYPKAQLGRAIGATTLTVALASAAGPTIAAAIISVATWHWLFLLNIPIGIAVVVLGLATLPAAGKTDRPFDIVGSALNAVTVGAIVLAIHSFGQSAPLPVLAVEAAVAGVLIAFLVRHQLAQAHPILPVDLMRIPIVRMSTIAAALVYVVQGLCYVVLPFRLVDEFGVSIGTLGVIMASWPLGVAALAPVAGRLAERHPPGTIGSAGLACLLVGLALVLMLPAGFALPDALWRMFMCGAGFGLFQASNSVAIINNAPPDRSGGAGATQGAARLVGQTVGAATAGALFGLAHAIATSLGLQIAILFATAALVVSAMRIKARE